MKAHLSHSSRRLLGGAAMLSFAVLYCLLSRSPVARAQHSQLAVAPGAAKPAAMKTIKPRSRVAPDPTSRSRLVTAYGNLPLSFEANKGQTDPRVKFLSRGSGYTLFLTSNEAVLTLRTAVAPLDTPRAGIARHRVADAAAFPRSPFLQPPFGGLSGAPGRLEWPQGRSMDLLRSTPARHQPLDAGHSALVARDSTSGLQMKLVGASPAAQVIGLDELPGKSNYFIGNNPKKWRTDVPNYAKVEYKSIYPGIDLVYYGNHRQLEYDFVVAPGANASAIRLDVGAGVGASDVAAGFSPATVKNAALKGASTGAQQAEALRIAPNGDLVMRIAGGNNEVRFRKPVIYQDVASGFSPASRNAALKGASTEAQQTVPRRRYLDGRYVLGAGNQVSFQVGAYDKTKLLIIDPVLTYSSLLGGSGGDAGYAIAVDGSGNVYLTGNTSQDGFPIVNQIPGACNGSCLSGTVDVAFVTKINAAASALVYSSYIGGSGGVNGADSGAAIAVDGSGNVYLTGTAYSPDFPRVNQIPGACNGTCGGGIIPVAFVTKINAAGNALVYSSLLGGSGGSGQDCQEVCDGDSGEGIAVDGSGDAYLTGETASPDFPRVNQIPGACNGTCGNGTGTGGFEDDYDIFVTKVNAAGSALAYSSYVGGSNEDDGRGIAVDSSGNAYLTGITWSTDFPRVNPISGACNGACGNGAVYVAFVTKVNAAGTALVYSSYLGGSGGAFGDQGHGIAVDSSDNAILTGVTSSPDFPIVNQIPGASQGCCNGENYSDVFVTKINAAGNSLVYSSFLGGTSYDEAWAIAVDSSGNAYLTGDTNSTDFPIVDQVQGACIDGISCGAFVTEVNAAGSALVYSSYLGGHGGFAGDIGFGIAVDGSGSAYLTGWSTSTDFPRVHQIPGACNGTCGTGLNFAVFAVKISPSGGPAVGLSPTSMTFGPQGVQAPNVPQVVTLTNTGQAPVSITSIAITGQNSGDFAQANNCPLSPHTLAPGDYCSITVVFEPAGAGTLNADVTVSDNAPGSPQSVALTGVGVSGKPGLAGPRNVMQAAKLGRY
ncbi:MAG: SBBP repeat-containing protein [Terriglobia bacterium]